MPNTGHECTWTTDSFVNLLVLRRYGIPPFCIVSFAGWASHINVQCILLLSIFCCASGRTKSQPFSTYSTPRRDEVSPVVAGLTAPSRVYCPKPSQSAGSVSSDQRLISLPLRFHLLSPLVFPEGGHQTCQPGCIGAPLAPY